MSNTFASNTTLSSGGGMEVTPEWQAWIAENALKRLSAQQIRDSMMAAGFDQATAEREVMTAMRHPYLVKAGEMISADAAGAAPEARSGGSTSRADKYAWFLEVARRNAKQAPSWGTVERVQKPSREEFLENFYSKNRPCIIEGALDDWPALTKWTGDYLKERCGDQPVEIQANRNSDDNYEMNSQNLKKEMRFSEAVDLIESGIETNDVYITANNSGINKQSLRALWDDIRFPDYLDGTAENDGFFWYGPKGVVTPIHHDLTNNFMAQVRGRKLVKIIAPWESADVYNHHHCFSPVDIFSPDLDQFPQMRGVDIIDVEIGPGDLFFLPVGWWHGVKGLELSITMTFTNFVYENDFFSFYENYGEID